MGRDELLEDRAAFIAGEIGGAVVELIIGGVVINSKRTARTVLTGTGYSVGRVIRQGNSSLT